MTPPRPAFPWRSLDWRAEQAANLKLLAEIQAKVHQLPTKDDLWHPVVPWRHFNWRALAVFTAAGWAVLGLIFWAVWELLA